MQARGIHFEPGFPSRKVPDGGYGICPNPQVCTEAGLATAIQDGSVSYDHIKSRFLLAGNDKQNSEEQ
jgi:hypothetical protein